MGMGGGVKNKSCKLVRFNALARCSAEDVFSSWSPPYLPHLDLGERAALQARHPLDLPLPILSQGQAGLSQRGQLTIPALQVQWMLQLGVDMLPERLPSF